MKLEFDNLTKNFGNHRVLTNISTVVDNFNSLVLIGPSGGGKTTLLRILAGLEIPNSGRVLINDNEINYNEKNLHQYIKKIGMVYQAYNLFPHLTALENITLPLTKVHGMNIKNARNEATLLLERFNLAKHMNKKPIALSGGQQQRIAICRAVAIKPDFLLFDEPTSALDPEFTSEVLDLILELKHEGIKLITVTHEMGFAKEVSDKVLFIEGETILNSGSFEDVFKNPDDVRIRSFLNMILKHNL